MIASNDDDLLDRCGPPSLVFRSPYLKGWRIEVRPADRPPPPAHKVSILYRGDESGLRQVGVGSYAGEGQWNNGKGKPLDPVGLHWTAIVDEH